MLEVLLPYPRTLQLQIPSLDTSFGTVQRYCVSVDSATGITTGISAADRATTARVLANPESTPESIIRPGHVVVTAVSEDASRTELSRFALELVETAGCGAAACIADLVSDSHPTEMAQLPEAMNFAANHGLSLVSIP